MKKLYYNPIEMPLSIKLISKTGEVREISEQKDPTELIPLDYLFDSIEDYKDILVKLTSHNEAYYPKHNGKGYERVPVKGEISLKEYVNGGGYLEDSHLYV